jgi:hypothetical protein
MSTTKTSKRHERKPGPYPADRECRGCGARPLSRNNPSDYCAPCSGGDWLPGEPTELEIRRLQKARMEELGAAA